METHTKTLLSIPQQLDDRRQLPYILFNNNLNYKFIVLFKYSTVYTSYNGFLKYINPSTVVNLIIFVCKMRFKSTILKEFADQSVVCIGWTGNDEIIIGRFEHVKRILFINNDRVYLSFIFFNIELHFIDLRVFNCNFNFKFQRNHI